MFKVLIFIKVGRGRFQDVIKEKSFEFHFRCNICGKAFAQAGTLQAHKPVHERRRSLCCELCGKSFLRKSHYRFHMQKHTNPPRFHCQDCPLAFYRKGKQAEMVSALL